MGQYNYIASLDEEKISLYTLQLANMKRIAVNDAIYIFDEVGAGKTISAGLSTIQLLFEDEYHIEYSKVLVITAPSVTRQFKKKFEEILDLKVGEEGKYNDKIYTIDIINYDYRNLRKVNSNTYDLIIIDEAHEFINKGTRRFQELIKLRAKKMLFMTATPIKYSKDDLFIYPYIASVILEKSEAALKEVFSNYVMRKKELCSEFNTCSPVTRYFKETVRNIEKIEGQDDFADKAPLRLVPELWEYVDDRDAYLASKLTQLKNDEKDSRAVVFVKYIKDAQSIEKALRAEGFVRHELHQPQSKTYRIITGEVTDRTTLLAAYSTTNQGANLPDVLIMTYQIAEQGIDLPAFNYIINYHIAASPSQLEQRFGRIDRMNSIHQELHTCFLVKKEQWDTDTANFEEAIRTYINEFLPFLPAKNCLITVEILNRLHNSTASIVAYYKEFIDIFKAYYKEAYEILLEVEPSGIVKWYDREINRILEFALDKNIESGETVEEFKSNFERELKRSIKQATKSDRSIKWWYKNINALSNNIFFIDLEEQEKKIDWSKKYDIENINPKQAAQQIVNQEDYQVFSDTFKEPLQIMHKWNRYKEELETYFEEAFHNNRFDILFPAHGVYVIDERYQGLKGQESKLISTLPFFKMCQAYKNIIQQLAYTADGFLYQNYNFNPFEKSVQIVVYQIEYLKEFFDKYYDYAKHENRQQLFFIAETNEGKIEASNWLKLFFLYSRIENFGIGRFKEGYSPYFQYQQLYTGDRAWGSGVIKNTYIKLSQLMQYIHEYTRYIAWLQQKDTPNVEEIKKYEKTLEALQEDYANLAVTWSLFEHFRYPLSQNKGGKLRTNSQNAIAIKTSLKGECHDEITNAILKDL